MAQAKLINDITDLVWLMRAFDSDVKRRVFEKVCEDWTLMDDIEGAFGEEGAAALSFFEKVKLVETRWGMDEGTAKKEYHAFYSSFHIKVISSVDMLQDVFSIALMDEETFQDLVDQVYEFVGSGELGREVERQFGLSSIQMKCLVKRSARLEYQGMKIIRIPT
ncbi:MAG: ArsR family transcriptional regulator [Candidatus Thermoplasmatota archaeon]|nr:ArsR family transcriptional regulator [Candidatus Thermoplasmatota archaeon]MDD5778166.1 ArsR family transcriptional regulator [Candidatus Thermoplasmatota archaeon]